MAIETWVPTFIVRNSGTSVVELEAAEQPRWSVGSTPFRVRRPGLTKQGIPYVGALWEHREYTLQFGATPREAIEKGLRHAAQRVAWFEARLAEAQARLACVQQLAAGEPQEQP